MDDEGSTAEAESRQPNGEKSDNGFNLDELLNLINGDEWDRRFRLSEHQFRREKSSRGLSGTIFGVGHDPKHLVAMFLALLIAVVLIAFAVAADDGLKDVISTGLGVLGTISGYVLGATNSPKE